MSKIESLSLRGFRCWEELYISTKSPLVAILGSNQSGKSSILEAISLMGSNRGMGMMRSYDEAVNRKYPGAGWLISAMTVSHQSRSDEIKLSFSEDKGRISYLNDKKITHQSLSNVVRPIWIPQDALYGFFASSSYRLRILDMLISLVYDDHYKNLMIYKKLSLNRLRTLINNGANLDGDWISSIEWEMSKLWREIALCRTNFICEAKKVKCIVETGLPTILSNFSKELSLDLNWKQKIAKCNEESDFAKILYDSRVVDGKARRSVFGALSYDFRLCKNDYNLNFLSYFSRSERTLILFLLLHYLAYIAQNSVCRPMLLMDEALHGLDLNYLEAAISSLAEFPKFGISVWISIVKNSEYYYDFLSETGVEIVNI